MQEPVWVRTDVVYAIHRRQIAEHGGGEKYLTFLRLAEGQLSEQQLAGWIRQHLTPAGPA
jgi:hypothetical protein